MSELEKKKRLLAEKRLLYKPNLGSAFLAEEGNPNQSTNNH
jgi:hypothetical protein